MSTPGILSLSQQCFRQFVVDAIELSPLVKVFRMRHARVSGAHHRYDLVSAPPLYREVNPDWALVFNQIPSQVNARIEILVPTARHKVIYCVGYRFERKLVQLFERIRGSSQKPDGPPGGIGIG